MASRLPEESQEYTKPCSICKEASAAVYCYQCKRCLCPECLTKHQKKAANHTTVPVAESLFCKSHDTEIVTLYCNECKKNLCQDCGLYEHGNHKTVDIKNVAHQCRQRLLTFLGSQTALGYEPFILKHVQAKLEEAKKVSVKFTESVDTPSGLIRDLEAKLKQATQETEDKLAAEIKTLSVYETDLNDSIASRKSLIDTARYLTQKAGDPEVVHREKDFPTSQIRVDDTIVKATVELPVLTTTFSNISAQLKQMVSTCKVNYAKAKIWESKKQHKLSVSVQYVSGLTMDEVRERLVVRTNDAAGPIKVYTYTGMLTESVGARVGSLADCSNHRGICMDTNRDRYMAPCPNTLLSVSIGGHLQTSITVGSDNAGVGYHKEADCYLVSSFNQHIVYVINAATSQVARQIGSHGSGLSQFNNPFTMHVGTVAGADNPCVLLSDISNNCVKAMNIYGGNIKVYGSSGYHKLSGPAGLATDPMGRVIVADQHNTRVTSFTTIPGGQEQCEILLSDDWGGNKPHHLALDPSRMVMAVCDSTNNIIHIYY